MVDFRKMFGNRIYILGAFALVSFFAFLTTIPGMSITCEDKVCDGLYCEVYCNVTNGASRSVYIYNYGEWTMDFSPNVEYVDLYIKYYGKWRYTNFTMKTRLGNIPESRKYVFVFPAYSTKQFKMILKMEDANRIKYTFGSLDPILIGWKIIYEQKEKTVPIYKERVTRVEGECWTNGTSEVAQCSPAYEYIIPYIDGYKTVKYDSDKLGIIAGDKYYKEPVNIKGNYISNWSIPIGDRNMEEFGRCREYEIRKNVCQEVDLLGDI